MDIICSLLAPDSYPQTNGTAHNLHLSENL